jgi:hypothetical protein
MLFWVGANKNLGGGMIDLTQMSIHMPLGCTCVFSFSLQ